jgi:hypothetical protein
MLPTPRKKAAEKIMRVTKEIEDLKESIGSIDEALLRSNCTKSIKLVDSQYFSNPANNFGN